MSTRRESEQSIRVVHLTGTARQRGRDYGGQCRDLIRLGVERWKDSIRDSLRVDCEQYLRTFVAETDFIPAIRESTPWVLEEIRGIAEGANLDFETALAYNLPDEEWWYRQPLQSSVSSREGLGCSVIGLRRGPDGSPVASQNMDVPDHYAGTEVVLHLTDESGREVLALAYAGSTGLCGCNGKGVSICCNTLLSLNHSTAGLPVNCIVRGVLAQTSLVDARSFIDGVRHASGQAYLIGSPDGLYGVEGSANGCWEYGAGSDRLWHTNHPIASLDRNPKVPPPPPQAVGDSERRGQFLQDRLPAIDSVYAIEQALSDRTVPLCRVPDAANPTVTFGCIVMELTAPPKVQLSVGPPDRNPYVDVSAFHEVGTAQTTMQSPC